MVLNAKGAQDYPHEVGKIAATSALRRAGHRGITDMMVFTKPYDHLKIYRDAEAEGLEQQAVLYYSSRRAGKVSKSCSKAGRPKSTRSLRACSNA